MGVVCEPLGWEAGTLWLLDAVTGALHCCGRFAAAGTPSSDEQEPGELVRLVRHRRAAGWSGESSGGAYAVPVLLGDVLLAVLEFRGSELREPDAANALPAASRVNLFKRHLAACRPTG